MLQPRVLRGRSLSSAATWSRRSAVWAGPEIGVNRPGRCADHLRPPIQSRARLHTHYAVAPRPAATRINNASGARSVHDETRPLADPARTAKGKILWRRGPPRDGGATASCCDSKTQATPSRADIGRCFELLSDQRVAVASGRKRSSLSRQRHAFSVRSPARAFSVGSPARYLG